MSTETPDAEGESLTDHDREVLWQTLGQCFSVAPNSPEACALVDAMVEQIVTSHVLARETALRETIAQAWDEGWREGAHAVEYRGWEAHDTPTNPYGGQA